MSAAENSTRVAGLLESLARECAGTQAGSNQGQFPILDLLGNLRDVAGSLSGGEALRAECAQAWERVVTIIESGRPFQADEIQWLREVMERLTKLAAAPAAPAPEPKVAALANALKEEKSFAAPALEPEEEAPLSLNLAEDGELLREFVNESREHLDNIEQGLLVLEQHPADAETLNTVFRAFHTFKGGAGFLNLLPVNRLAHALESLLDLARQHKLVISPPVIELILRGWDTLKKFIDEIDGQVAGSRLAAPLQIPTAKLKADVLALVESVSAGTAAPAPSAPVAPLPSAAPAEEPSPPEAAEPVVPVSSGQTAPAEPTAPSRRAEQAAVVKVDTGKLDTLLDLVGEMVIAQSLVSQDLNQLAELNPRFARNVAQLSQISRELQRVSMSMRMVPIRGAFQKMARVVRDLSAKQQKQVQLLTSGEDTELDRGMVEELNDPLLHMIRNSIDHGVESAEARVARGKPALATLHLRAYHQGGNIVLEIGDDGAGLDKDRILAKAVERGLTAPDAKLTEEEIFKFIFAPGFSTASQITDISGRGVGLDVVRRNLERLRGRMEVSSKPGQGTTFKITLPLTLAIIEGLIVQVGAERYILPTLAVRESFHPRAEMISTIQGRGEVVNVRGRLLPLLRLYECFGVTPNSTDPAQAIVVVVQSGANCRCLLVDSLLHKQEVVIKNLSELMVHQNRFLAGAAILGDGRVALILDVNALVHLEAQPFAHVA